MIFRFLQIEKNQILITNVWLDQEWQDETISKRKKQLEFLSNFCFRYDEFLQWNPADFNGIRRLNLPSRLIWLPDIVLYNVRRRIRLIFQKIFIVDIRLFNRMLMNFPVTILCKQMQ